MKLLSVTIFICIQIIEYFFNSNLILNSWGLATKKRPLTKVLQLRRTQNRLISLICTMFKILGKNIYFRDKLFLNKFLYKISSLDIIVNLKTNISVSLQIPLSCFVPWHWRSLPSDMETSHHKTPGKARINETLPL